MESIDIATKLLRGGFSVNQAADILLWLSEVYRYDRVEALSNLEEIAPMLAEEELWIPQPWYGELLYLRKRHKEGKSQKADTKPYRGLSIEKR